MRESWFLEIDGIVGESVDDRHAGEIEVQSWSWGVATPPASTGAGRIGRAVVDDLQLTTHVSSASPALLAGLRDRSPPRLGHVDRRALGRGGAPYSFLSYALTDVLITSVRHGDATGGAPFEQVALHAGAVEITYRRQLPNGATAPPVTAVVGSSVDRLIARVFRSLGHPLGRLKTIADTLATGLLDPEEGQLADCVDAPGNQDVTHPVNRSEHPANMTSERVLRVR